MYLGTGENPAGRSDAGSKNSPQPDQGANTVRRLALVPIALAALLLSAAAQAVGLGEIEMQSALNQRLDAEIPLRGVSAEQSANIEVDLASEQAFRDAGLERPFALTRLRFAVKERDDERYYVQVTSTQPVVEPFLSFLVEVDWPGGNLLREYTVLLDPPVFASKEQGGEAGDDEPADAETAAAADDAGVPGDIERSAEPPEDDGRSQAEAEAEEAKRQAQRDSRKPVFLRIEEEEERAERDAAERARAEAEAQAAEPKGAEAEPSAAEEATGGPDEYGPVERGESLWNIAARLKRGDMTVQQMMLALLRYNPDAFADKNINRLKQGYVLRVPDARAVRSVSAQRAIARVEEQNAVWRKWRGDGDSGKAVAASEQAAGQASAETGSADSGESGDAQLSIVGSEGGGASGDESATATGSGDTSTSEKLKLAREQLESARMQKKELASRVEELEETVDKMDKLLSVRNERLNALQEELRKLEEETGTEVAENEEATADPGEETQATGTGETTEGAATTAAGETTEAAGDDEEVAAAGASGGSTGGGDGVESGTDGTADDPDSASAEPTGEDAGAGADGGDGEAASSEVAAAGSGASTPDGGAGSGDTTGADDDAAADGDSATAEAEAGTDYVPEDKRATAEDRGLETTRTEPAQDTWLDRINNGMTAVAGIFAGGGAGVLMGPVGLGLAAVILLAAAGTVLMRRRSARAEEGESVDLEEMAFDTGAPEFEDAAAEAPETGASADESGDRTRSSAEAEEAESALMAEQFDLGSLDEEASAASTRGQVPASGGDETLAGDDDEADKDDTIAEADVYLAYGLHKQAEDLLRLALEERPESAGYREKLLETLYAAGKEDEFVEAAGTFHDQVTSTRSRSWQRVLAMGRELAPKHALFAEGDTEYSAADVAPSRPGEADLELDEGGGDLDFAFDEETGEEGADAFSSTGALDRGQDAPVEGDAGLAGPGDDAPAKAEGGGEEDELEFDLGELDALDEGGQGARQQGSADASDLDFDLDDRETTATASAPADKDEGLDFDLELGEEETGDSGAAREPVSDSSSGPGEEALDVDLDLGEEDDREATRTSAAPGGSESAEAESPDFDLDLEDSDTAGESSASATSTATAGAGEGDAALAFDLGEDDDREATRTSAAPGGSESAEAGSPDFDLDLADSDSAAESSASATSTADAGEGEDEALELGDLDLGELEAESGATAEPGTAQGSGPGTPDLSEETLATAGHERTSEDTAPATGDAAALEPSELDGGPASGGEAVDLGDLDAGDSGGEDDFDLSEFEAEAAANAGSATGAAGAAEETQRGTPESAPEASGEAEDFDTMLDLARAYIDMGDPDSAANALEEVATSGDEKQREEAKSLLESVR